MTRFNKVAMLMLGLALVAGSGCTSTVASASEPLAIAKADHTAQVDVPLHAPVPCGWECSACDDGDSCVQSCVEIGSCGSTCSVVSQCAEGYTWDDASCSCISQ